MSAVTPSELRWFTLAPASRMMCSTVSEPLDDAAISAVIADLSWWRASTDWPFCFVSMSSIRT